LVVERLEDAETFRVVAFTKGIVIVLKKNVVLVAFAWSEPGTVKVFEFKFEVKIFEILEVAVTFKLVPKIEAPLRVVTLVEERLLVPVTLAVVNHAFAILEVPKTLRLTRGPNDVIFD
jgi:hypothetical protein